MATPITTARTTRTKNIVMPRNRRSVGLKPKRSVTRASLRCMTLPRVTGTCCCMHPPFHQYTISWKGSKLLFQVSPWSEFHPGGRVASRLQEGIARHSRALPFVARTAATHHGFDLCLILGDDGGWQRDIVEGQRVLLAIMRDPPEHIRKRPPPVSIRLILVDDRPAEACNRIGGIAGSIDDID